MKSIKLNLAGCILMLILITSCHDYPKEIQESFKMAGKNKQELVKVLKFYKKNSSDSLKYEAALFLIKNMKWHYSQKIEMSNDVWNLFFLEDSLIKSKIQHKGHWKYDRALNGYKYLAKKILHKDFENLFKKGNNEFDLCGINANLLIENIEYAFKVKNMEWNKNLNFDEFCEYILPYRFNSEPVFNIRKTLFNQFSYLNDVDSLKNNSKKIISFSNRYITDFNWDWDEPNLKVNDYGFFNIYYWNVSSMFCNHHVAIQGQFLRSIGVPVTEVFTPVWRDTDIGHSWLGLYSRKGVISIFSAIYEDPGTNSHLWSLKRATKFYLKTFAPNKDSPFFLKSETEELPKEFSNPCIKDITSTLVDVESFEIKLEKINISINLSYFCLFINGQWKPVGWGKINKEKQTTYFENIPVGLIGVPCYYENNKMTPCASLLKIEKNKIIEVKPKKEVSELQIIRKFPYKTRMQYFNNKIIGTKIEASNNSEFSDSIILSVLTDTLIPYYQDHYFDNSRKFQYYRIIAPGYQLNIAELEFLTNLNDLNTEQASPLPIFNLEDTLQDTYFKYSKNFMGDKINGIDYNAFDGNILTYTEMKWAGIDLGIPRTINRIRIVPRNADNGIKVGNNYELFYWDNKWISVGRKKAEYNFVSFDKVPSHTLYWLRNLDMGNEELPFLIIDGKQTFINQLE